MSLLGQKMCGPSDVVSKHSKTCAFAPNESMINLGVHAVSVEKKANDHDLHRRKVVIDVVQCRNCTQR